jgi:inorganic pyrophosphatase
MEDEAGDDAKVLAVPVNEITGLYRHVQSVDDVDALLKMQIEHFFSHYKDLEKNKWVKVSGWEDIDAARQEVIDAVERFNRLPDKPNF